MNEDNHPLDANQQWVRNITPEPHYADLFAVWTEGTPEGGSFGHGRELKAACLFRSRAGEIGGMFLQHYPQVEVQKFPLDLSLPGVTETERDLRIYEALGLGSGAIEEVLELAQRLGLRDSDSALDLNRRMAELVAATGKESITEALGWVNEIKVSERVGIGPLLARIIDLTQLLREAQSFFNGQAPTSEFATAVTTWCKDVQRVLAYEDGTEHKVLEPKEAFDLHDLLSQMNGVFADIRERHLTPKNADVIYYQSLLKPYLELLKPPEPSSTKQMPLTAKAGFSGGER